MAKSGKADVCAKKVQIPGAQEMTLIDILSLTEETVSTLRTSLNFLDSSLYKEFREIAVHIAETKKEVGLIQAENLRSERIPEAGRELEAVVEATESATNQIMESAETIMTADPSNPATYHATINDCIMSIFEACSFQDITGQRISKVVETLNFIDKRIGKFANTIGNIDDCCSDPILDDEEAQLQERRKRLILNGPQIDNRGASQEDIDNLFS